MPLEPGQVVDQYRLDQTIHRGRATIVYAATDLGLGRKVAFKVLADRYATDEVIRQRFVNEAQVAASLDGHPHIVTVYKWGEFEGSMYFVTELIDGISLAELLERQPGGRPLQPNEALELLGADRRRPRLRPQARGDPPRRQAGQRDGQDDRHAAFGVPRRLRHHEDGRRRDRTAGDVPRHAGLRLAGADLRRPGARPRAPTSTRSPARRSRCSPGDRRTATPRTTRPASPSPSAEPGAERPSAAARSCHRPSTTSSPRRWPRTVRIATRSCGEFVRELRDVFPAGTHIFRRPPPPGADLPAPSLYTARHGATPQVAVGRRRRRLRRAGHDRRLLRHVATRPRHRRRRSAAAADDHDHHDHDHHDHDDDHRRPRRRRRRRRRRPGPVRS